MAHRYTQMTKEVVVVSFYRITCQWQAANGKLGRWDMRFQTNVGLTPLEQQAIVDAAQTSSNGDVPTLFCADISWASFQTAEYELVTPPGWNPATPAAPFPFFRDVTTPVDSGVAPVPGVVVGQSLPPQNAFVVSFGTGLAGRRHRGRVYTPPPPESSVGADGALSDFAARNSWIQDIAVAVEGAIVPTNIDHGVHSAWYDLFTDVVSYGGGSRIDTQRRRLSRTR